MHMHDVLNHNFAGYIFWRNILKYYEHMNCILQMTLNDIAPLDPIQQRHERKRRYYAWEPKEKGNYSGIKQKPCKKETLTDEMKYAEISKLTLQFNNINDIFMT